MARKPYQVRRQDLTDQEWEYLSTKLFPLMKELKRKAMAARESRGSACLDG